MVQMPSVIRSVVWGGELTVVCGLTSHSPRLGIKEAIWPPSGILTSSTGVPTEHLLVSVGVAVQLPEQ